MSDAQEVSRIISNSGRAVSAAGSAWLSSCLNPYSDFQQQLVGYPDMNTQPSVVLMYSSQMDVTAPASAAGGNWDCCIYTIPVDSTGGYGVVSTSNECCVYDHASLPSTTIWGLTSCSNAAGADVSLMSSTAARAGLNSRNVTGQFGRVIAKGFEVNNTTAEIYRQGNLTVALVPSCPRKDVTISYIDTNATPWVAASKHCFEMGTMPETLAQVRAIPQSAQWEAAKGVYFVPRMSSPPDLNMEYRSGLMYTSSTVVYSPAVLSSFSGTPTTASTSVDSFCGVVAYFSGLSNQTTLTVSYRTIVEYFPSPSSNLISEASPSAAYEPSVLQVYNEVVKQAPYAVPVGQNAAGDFFRKVLGAVRTVAPIASKVLTPFPVLSRAASTVGSVANRVNNVFPPRPVLQAPAPRMIAMPVSRMAPKKRKSKKRKSRARHLPRDSAGYFSAPMRWRPY